MLCCAAFSSVILSLFMLAGYKQMLRATGTTEYQKSQFFFLGFCIEITSRSKLATSPNMLKNIDRKKTFWTGFICENNIDTQKVNYNVDYYTSQKNSNSQIIPF